MPVLWKTSIIDARMPFHFHQDKWASKGSTRGVVKTMEPSIVRWWYLHIIINFVKFHRNRDNSLGTEREKTLNEQNVAYIMERKGKERNLFVWKIFRRKITN